MARIELPTIQDENELMCASSPDSGSNWTLTASPDWTEFAMKNNSQRFVYKLGAKVVEEARAYHIRDLNGLTRILYKGV